MQAKNKKTAAALRLLPLLLSAALLLSSCGSTWDWLWTRDLDAEVSTEDLIIRDDTELSAGFRILLENAIEYTGEAHEGTEIAYVGREGSPNRDRIIVIDAGHQLKGSNKQEPNGPGSEIMKSEVSYGSTGAFTGQLEYELNLQVALLLRDELIRRGYSVVMIRETNNVQISNMNRAQIANKYRADAFIRIHANGWTDPAMKGAKTICQSARNPYPDCAAHYMRSRLLSSVILEEFCAYTDMDLLPVFEADDNTGTNWSQVPTTIVEMGFLSNKEDDSLMRTETFRSEAAVGIANGLDAYFRELY